jgi:molybdopterin biosynthesis enzyme
MRVGALVQESLGARSMARFRESLGEKVEWFGSSFLQPVFVAPDAGEVERGMRRLLADGAQVIAVAGSKPMDPLDAAFEGLERIGATMVRRGVPAHPGSLCWLARAGDVPVVGMPTCGLFSQATVFDLVLPRLLTGERLDGGALTMMGHGGFLTRDMAFRFPPYRAARERGAVE